MISRQGDLSAVGSLTALPLLAQ